MCVDEVPSLRFLGNEAFLFQVTNGNFLPYFGSISLDNKILASDLHLHYIMDPYNLFYTFRIDVSIHGSSFIMIFEGFMQIYKSAIQPKPNVCHFHSAGLLLTSFMLLLHICICLPLYLYTFFFKH